MKIRMVDYSVEEKDPDTLTPEEMLAHPICNCASCKDVLDQAYAVSFNLLKDARSEEDGGVPDKCLYSQLMVANLIPQYYGNMIIAAIIKDKGMIAGAMFAKEVLVNIDHACQELIKKVDKYVCEQVEAAIESGSETKN